MFPHYTKVVVLCASCTCTNTSAAVESLEPSTAVVVDPLSDPLLHPKHPNTQPYALVSHNKHQCIGACKGWEVDLSQEQDISKEQGAHVIGNKEACVLPGAFFGVGTWPISILVGKNSPSISCGCRFCAIS